MTKYFKLLLFVFSLVWHVGAFAAGPIEDWLADDNAKVPAGKMVNWKFAHPAPPVSLLPPIWQEAFDWLNVASRQRMNVKMYGGGALYGFAGGVKAIRAGIADSGTCYSVAEPKGFELLKTFHAPFVSPTNPALTTRIMQELGPKWLKDEFKRRGVYAGHLFATRPLSLMSKHPIRTPEDLKGKKVVSFMNAPGVGETLGFAEVRLPFPEIYTALQQGLVDAVFWLENGFIPFKVYEQAKYFTEVNIAPGSIETCINRRSFDRLPKDLKPLVYDFQQALGMSMVKSNEDFARSARETFEKNKVEIITLTAEQQNAWKIAFEPMKEAYFKECEEVGKDCRGLAKEIEQLANKYQGLSDDELMRLAIEKPVPGWIEF